MNEIEIALWIGMYSNNVTHSQGAHEAAVELADASVEYLAHRPQDFGKLGAEYIRRRDHALHSKDFNTEV